MHIVYFVVVGGSRALDYKSLTDVVVATVRISIALFYSLFCSSVSTL